MTKPAQVQLRITLGVTALFAAQFMAGGASADENLLGYTSGTDTLPKGRSEAYLWVTDRRDKGQGEYNAQDYSIEFEHGLTDRLQGAAYLDFRSHHIEGAAPVEESVPEYPDLSRDFAFQGVKASLKYNFLSPYKDGFGLSLYVEPGYSGIKKISGERDTLLFLETKLIAQKNFLDDQLIWAANLTFEQEFGNEEEEEWEAEAELEFTSGLSYRFAPNWYAGLEVRYHSEYPNFPEDAQREHYAIFLGPTIHYGARRWWATVTYLPQVIGRPVDEKRSGNVHLDEHERREIRVKLGYNF